MNWLVVNLRLAFAVFVITGAGFIFTLSRLAQRGEGGSAVHWILVSAILGLMVIFGIVVWVRSRTQHAAESDAETFYYLGFIYTLLTLVATFTPLLAEGSKPSTQQVLGLFGLGLITTFFGLAGRVFFLQARTGDSLDSNIDRLSQASAEAARSLDSTAVQISRVGSEIERVALKSHESLLGSIEKATERLAAHSQKLFEDANSRVIALTNTTATHVDETLRIATERLTAALDEFGSRVAAVKLPPAELGERLKEAVTALIQASEHATNTASAFTGKLTAANKELSGLAPGLASATASFAGLSTAAKSTTVGLESVGPAVAQAAIAVKAAAGDLATVQQRTKDLGITMEKLAVDTTRASPAMSKLAEDIAKVAENLKRLVDAMSGAEGSAVKLSEAQQQSVRELLRATAALKAHHDAVQQLATELQQDLKASEEAVRKVHGNLIAATEFLTAKVQ